MKKLIFPFFAALAILYAAAASAQNLSFEFVKQFEGPAGNSHPSSITTDAAGNVYLCGYFANTVDFDPGAGIFNMTSTGGDIYIGKYDPSGNLVWAKQLACFLASGLGVHIDASGNVYVSGEYEGVMDLDPGPGVNNQGTPSGFSVFVSKLDASGNYVWGESFGTAHDAATALDDAGNIYIHGSFEGAVDFDPGPGSYPLQVADSQDLFLLKLNSAGNLMWARQMPSQPGGYNYCFASVVKIDVQGNIILSGGFLGTNDFDPGPGVHNVTSMGASGDIYVTKLDPSGNFLWSRNAGVSIDLLPSRLDADSSGNIYVFGAFADSLDFGPGLSSNNLGGVDFLWQDAYIFKLNGAGDLGWARSIHYAQTGTGNSIKADNSGGLVIAGSFSVATDFDPGVGVDSLTPTIYGSGYLARYDTSGNFSWVEFAGDSGQCGVSCVTFDNGGHIYAAGNFYYTVDFDNGPANTNTYGSGVPSFLLKNSLNGCSNMTVGVDSVIPVSCSSGQGILAVHGAGGIAPYTYAWNTTPVTTAPSLAVSSAGIYQVNVTDDLGCTRSASFLANAPAYPAAMDLDVNIATTAFKPGMNAAVVLDAFNSGCMAASGSLKLILDGQVMYNSSLPAPDVISGDTLIWNFSGFNFDDLHLTPTVSLTPPSGTPLGSSICLTAIMSSINVDANTVNNVKTFCRTVTGSFDPNDIQVYPGTCAQGYIVPGTRLSYTVNFQNTGTTQADNIYVLDTLDAGLDINTVKIVGSSHPMITEVLAGNVLKFRFDDINLPDSNSNEPLSHGYLIYEADHQTSLATGAVLANQAAIYFDFNAPVLTNEVHSTLISVIPPCNVGIKNIPEQAVLIYPNPSTGMITVTSSRQGVLEITDMPGRARQLVQIPGKGQHVVNLEPLGTGMFLYRFKAGQTILTGKLLIQ